MESTSNGNVVLDENIKVAVRIRPLSNGDTLPIPGLNSCLDVAPNCQLLVLTPPVSETSNSSSNSSSIIPSTPSSSHKRQSAQAPATPKSPHASKLSTNSLPMRSPKPSGGLSLDLNQVPASPAPSRTPLSPRVSNTPSSSLQSQGQQQQQQKYFTFDKVYLPSATQDAVFADVQPYVDSAVKGYNATVFTYGQTGAGKTHTMFGRTDVPSQSGIVPRSIERIFQLIEQRHSEIEYSVHVSFVELHLDQFVDLLAGVGDGPGSSKKRKLNSFSGKNEGNKIKIREDTRTKTVFMTGAEKRLVTSASQAIRCVTEAFSNRAVASTQMNDQSSRSHCVLTFFIDSRPINSAPATTPAASSAGLSSAALHVQQIQQNQQRCVAMGKLHLVDLAGSERLSRSGVEGEAQKEAQKINKTLTALGDVLCALSSNSNTSSTSTPGGRDHPIPYRNSKLTRLLQDSLGGNSRTFFIVNVSAAPENYRETSMSLHYGQRAKKVRNQSMINKDPSLMFMMQQRGLGGGLGGTSTSLPEALEAMEAVYKRELEVLRKQIKEKEDELRVAQTEASRYLEDLKLAKCDKDRSLRAAARESSKQEEELRVELDTAREEIEKLNYEATQNTLIQNQSRRRITALELEVVLLKDKCNEMEQKAAQRASLVGELETEREAIVRQRDEWRDRAEAAESNLERLKERLNETEEHYKTKLAQLEESMQCKKQGEVAKVQEEQQKWFKTKQETLRKEIEQLRDEKVEVEQNLARLHKQLEEETLRAKREQDLQEREMETLRRENESLQRERKQLLKSNEALQKQLESQEEKERGRLSQKDRTSSIENLKATISARNQEIKAAAEKVLQAPTITATAAGRKRASSNGAAASKKKKAQEETETEDEPMEEVPEKEKAAPRRKSAAKEEKESEDAGEKATKRKRSSTAGRKRSRSELEAEEEPEKENKQSSQNSRKQQAAAPEVEEEEAPKPTAKATKPRNSREATSTAKTAASSSTPGKRPSTSATPASVADIPLAKRLSAGKLGATALALSSASEEEKKSSTTATSNVAAKRKFFSAKAAGINNGLEEVENATTPAPKATVSALSASSTMLLAKKPGLNNTLTKGPVMPALSKPVVTTAGGVRNLFMGGAKPSGIVLPKLKPAGFFGTSS